MKIIKFKKKEKFKYKRKVIIKDLILNISIGIHNFEKKKRQKSPGYRSPGPLGPIYKPHGPPWPHM